MVNIRSLVILGALAASTGAFAGSLITTNLPANTTIVNIDATVDGAAGSANNFSDWFSPFANDVQLGLVAGTYTFTIVDRTDAAALFPSLTSTQLNTINGAWTYNSPWLTDWMGFDSSAITDPSQSQLISGAVSDQGYGNASLAYASAKSRGVTNQLKISPGGRASGTVATSYTLAQARTLVFAIPDQGVADNAGGVSVIVRRQVQSTPEPAPLAAMALGGLAMVRRRRRQGTVATRS